MKKIILILIVVVCFASLVFAYTPAPYPVVQSGDPFIFDPNDAQSPVMGADIVYVGQTKTGTIEVTEPDGEDVTITANQITLSSTPATVKDPNDSLGLAVKHTYGWSWSPVATDIGLHYVNVVVSDPQGLKDERTLVLLIKVNQPPVITGCTK